MAAMESAIASALKELEAVVHSRTDDQTLLYYRMQKATQFGDKLLCVVVKYVDDDAFIITAYLTDRIKPGARLWPPK